MINQTTTSGVDRVRAFFDLALPAVIEERKDTFNRSTGTLALHVDGTGAWTIAFGDHESDDALFEDPSMGLDADCIAIFSTSDFVSLLDGRTPSRAPVVMGEAAMLELLGQLIEGPAKGGLGARLLAR